MAKKARYVSIYVIGWSMSGDEQKGEEPREKWSLWIQSRILYGDRFSSLISNSLCFMNVIVGLDEKVTEGLSVREFQG